MADVFISYKSEDRAAAGLYAQALQAEGLSVWWDPVLRTGETYDEVIERNLREAAVVVVLWSPRSVKSKWVRAEATIGERKGGLLPVLIEACDRPIAFELTQTADLSGWNGDRAEACWLEFVENLRGALATRQAEVRAHTAPPPPDPLTIETLFWSSIKDGADVADFEAYLARYPHGHFVEIARNKVRADADRRDRDELERREQLKAKQKQQPAERHRREQVDAARSAQWHLWRDSENAGPSHLWKGEPRSNAVGFVVLALLVATALVTFAIGLYLFTPTFLSWLR